MLKLENIKKDYKSGDTTVQALKGINIQFRKSEFVSILGQSGCGKTTLLNIISGKDTDYEGQVENCGLVECVEQNLNLIENMSVLDNLLLVNNDPKKNNRYVKTF